MAKLVDSAGTVGFFFSGIGAKTKTQKTFWK